MNEFMKQIISKALKSLIKKKLGYEIDISLNKLDTQTIDDEKYVCINADIVCEEKQINSFIQNYIGKNGGEK